MCEHQRARAYFDIREPGRHIAVCDDCQEVLSIKTHPLPDHRTDSYVVAMMAGAAAILRAGRQDDEPMLDPDVGLGANILAGAALDAMLTTGCVELREARWVREAT